MVELGWVDARNLFQLKSGLGQKQIYIDVTKTVLGA